MKSLLRELWPYREHLPEVGLWNVLDLARRQGGKAAIDLLDNARLLRRSGLFDRRWYCATYADVPERTALGHFLLSGAREGRSPGPGFDSAYYLAAHPDVAAAGVIPVLHFEVFGRSEGRLPLPPTPEPEEQPAGPWSPGRLAAAARAFHSDAAGAGAALARRPPQEWLPRLEAGSYVEVFVHSAGNIFMREIAELVAAGFAAAGFRSTLRDEQAALDTIGGNAGPEEPRLRLVIAPHEFFLLTGKNGDSVPMDWATGAVMLNVEQLYTPWFQVGLPALRQSKGVFDINLQSAAALAELGMPTAFLPLGFVPDFTPFQPAERLPDLPALATLEREIRESLPRPEAPLNERPIDIFFIGYLSPRRSDILQRMAGRLSRWRCHFVLTSADRPQVRGRNALLDTEATIGIARRSKIVLNLHQGDETFFEWHRIVLQGIWQQALVVTEAVAAQACFTGGEHFLAAPSDELADLLDWVLGTTEGMAVAEKVRHQAHQQLTQNVRFDSTLRTLFRASTDKRP